MYEPNIIFISSATLNQFFFEVKFFSEVNSDWAGIFYVDLFDQSRANCTNPDHRIK